MNEVLYRANDNLLQLTGLTQARTKQPVTDAVVTVTLVDTDGAQLSGVTWPLTMSNESGSNDYYCVVDAALVVAVDQRVFAEITVTSGTLDAFWRISMRVAERTE